MPRIILQHFSLVFPHTNARLAHWHFLCFYKSIDPFDIIIAILPFCIYCVNAFRGRYIQIIELPNDRRDPFRVINHCIRFWFLVYKLLDLVAALGMVLRVPGFRGKALLAMDLMMESTMVLVAKTVFFIAIGVFLSIKVDGFPVVRVPFVGAFCRVLWMGVQYINLGLVEILNAMNEVVADDLLDEE